MNFFNRISFSLVFIILFVFIIIFYRALFYVKPHEIPSTLIGKPLPNFNLPAISPYNELSSNQFPKDQPVLINIFATWCNACQLEVPLLNKITTTYHVPIYGIAYKDQPQAVSDWLATYGNPYATVGVDTKGDVAIDFGVYGTPETYVINRQGNIIYRHVGLLDEKTWDQIIYPIIKAQTK